MKSVHRGNELKRVNGADGEIRKIMEKLPYTKIFNLDTGYLSLRKTKCNDQLRVLGTHMITKKSIAKFLRPIYS